VTSERFEQAQPQTNVAAAHSSPLPSLFSPALTFGLLTIIGARLNVALTDLRAEMSAEL
jgi:hypothetical protein